MKTKSQICHHSDDFFQVLKHTKDYKLKSGLRMS